MEIRYHYNTKGKRFLLLIIYEHLIFYGIRIRAIRVVFILNERHRICCYLILKESAYCGHLDYRTNVDNNIDNIHILPVFSYQNFLIKCCVLR